jgi:hypothetical protein
MSDPMYSSLVTGKTPPPPAFKMHAMDFLFDIFPSLHLGLDPKTQIEIFRAHIGYLKRCSEVETEFYTNIEHIINKPIEQLIKKPTPARKRK